MGKKGGGAQGYAGWAHVGSIATEKMANDENLPKRKLSHLSNANRSHLSTRITPRVRTLHPPSELCDLDP